VKFSPDAALDEIWRLTSGHRTRLAYLVGQLDEHLRHGGGLPRAWQVPPHDHMVHAHRHTGPGHMGLEHDHPHPHPLAVSAPANPEDGPFPHWHEPGLCHNAARGRHERRPAEFWWLAQNGYWFAVCASCCAASRRTAAECPDLAPVKLIPV
jgi:hypothetical protein